MQKITPFLWLDNNVEEAVNFYTSVFPDSEIVNVSRSGKGGPGPEGAVMAATFRLHGQEFMALNGGPRFKFNEAISFFVKCETQDEIDYFWDRLGYGGRPSQCGWLKDKFGLSWQIVPATLGRMLADKDPEKSKRVMQAMLKMAKLDINKLRDA